MPSHLLPDRSRLREGEREKEREREVEREKERKKVCVCVCERERVRAKERNREEKCESQGQIEVHFTGRREKQIFAHVTYVPYCLLAAGSSLSSNSSPATRRSSLSSLAGK